MITEDTIAQCQGTADFIPYLRDEFEKGQYAAVVEAITRFVKAAEANRSLARKRLEHMLKPWVYNYVVGVELQAGQVSDWAIAFPRLLTEEGAAQEGTWEAFVEEAVRQGPEAFAVAMAVIQRTCRRFAREEE